MFDNNRWYLDDIPNVDNWRFTSPPMIPMEGPLRFGDYRTSIYHSGKPLDYTTAGHASVPVVTFKALQAISGLDGFTALLISIEDVEKETEKVSKKGSDSQRKIDELHLLHRNKTCDRAL